MRIAWANRSRAASARCVSPAKIPAMLAHASSKALPMTLSAAGPYVQPARILAALIRPPHKERWPGKVRKGQWQPAHFTRAASGVQVAICIHIMSDNGALAKPHQKLRRCYGLAGASQSHSK